MLISYYLFITTDGLIRCVKNILVGGPLNFNFNWPESKCVKFNTLKVSNGR